MGHRQQSDEIVQLLSHGELGAKSEKGANKAISHKSIPKIRATILV